MTDRELMQQALHTLEGWANHGEWVWPESALEQAKRNTTESIAALRERLAHCDRCGKKLGGPDHIHTCSPQQPVQEPVAEVKLMVTGGNAGVATRIVEIDDPMRERLRPGDKLYTAPQPRQSQGLTKDQREDFAFACESYETVVAIEQVLREKNEGGV